MSNFLDNAKKTPVYFEVKPGQHVKAPFDLVQVAGSDKTGETMDFAVSTVGFGSEMEQAYNSDTVADEQTLARGDIGYTSLPPVVLQEHEMGDFEGHPDDWRGVHKFDRL